MPESAEKTTEHSGGLFDLAGEVGTKKVEAFKFTLNQGIAVAVILVFLWFTYMACSWLGREIFEPGRDRMFRHLDRIEETLKKQEEAMETVKDCINQSTTAEVHTVEALKSLESQGKEQTAVLRDIRDQRKSISPSATAVMAPGNE